MVIIITWDQIKWFIPIFLAIWFIAWFDLLEELRDWISEVSEKIARWVK